MADPSSLASPSPSHSPRNSSSVSFAFVSPDPPASVNEVARLQAEIARLNAAGNAVVQERDALARSRARSPAPATRSAIKPPTLTPFTGLGQENSVDTFLRNVTKQFHFDRFTGGHQFDDEDHQIQFAVFYLDKAAAEWWESADRSSVRTWDQFVETMRSRYRPTLPAEVARAKLFTLKQTGAVSGYCNAFQLLISQIPDMSAADQIFQFKRGLKPPIAVRVAEDRPDTLQDAIDVAVGVEQYVTSFDRARPFAASNHGAGPMDLNAMQATTDPFEAKYPESESAQLLALMKEQHAEFLNALHARPTGTTKPAAAATKGPPKLTDAERERCFRENLCLRCRGAGHRAAECPKFPSNRQNGRLNY